MRQLAIAAVVLVASHAAVADDDSVYTTEAVGPLHTNMTDAELVKALGKPTKKQTPEQEGATGQWVATWTWKDASALLVSDDKKGPWHARNVSGSRKDWKTKKGIHVGSTRAEVEKAYPHKPDDWPQQDKDQYLVGSPYGGMLIFLEKDRVDEIAIGVFAF